MAPEVLEENMNPVLASDIFSLGVITLWMVLGRFPFYAKTKNLHYNYFASNRSQEYWNGMNPNISANLKRLLTLML